jgi:hypothetical protein
VLQLDWEHDQQAIVKNDVQVVNSWIQKQDYVVHVVMDFINQKKVRSLVYSVDWDKLHDRLRLHHETNVAMNVNLECSSVAMDVVNHALAVHTEHKEFNRHVMHVLLVEQHLKLELHPSRNVHYQFARLEHI